jgi:hypothetical protein
LDDEWKISVAVAINRLVQRAFKAFSPSVRIQPVAVKIGTKRVQVNGRSRKRTADPAELKRYRAS